MQARLIQEINQIQVSKTIEMPCQILPLEQAIYIEPEVEVLDTQVLESPDSMASLGSIGKAMLTQISWSV